MLLPPYVCATCEMIFLLPLSKITFHRRPNLTIHILTYDKAATYFFQISCYFSKSDPETKTEHINVHTDQ